jgi:hypothetical protein
VVRNRRIVPISPSSVAPAEAGVQGRASGIRRPCSCQGQALGARFRGHDEKGGVGTSVRSVLLGVRYELPGYASSAGITTWGAVAAQTGMLAAQTGMKVPSGETVDDRVCLFGEYVCFGWPRYPRPALGCLAVNFEPIHAGHGEDFMT